MAAPSYTTDLTDVDTAEAVTNWAESLATGWDKGGSPAADTDYPFIQGTVAISQTMTKTAICSLLANNGSGITLPTDGAYLVWQAYASPGPSTLDTVANGGMRVMVGSSTTDFYSWDTGGSDFGRNPYGGWMNVAVNTGESSDDTVGTPTATEQYIGSAIKTLAGIGKGNPHTVDAIRWGRCEARMNGGDVTNGYATFAGFAAENDKNITSYYHRWGLIQDQGGGIYLWKGLMRLGYTSAVDFRDSDVTILVDDTPKATSNFSKIDIEQSGSNVEWTNITFIALGTQSKGNFEAVADATIALDGCKFVDMGTFIFDSNSSVDDTTFQRCGQVTVGAGDFDGCLFEESTAASAVSAATPAEAALIVNSDFVSDGTGHGITLTGTAANITLTNVSFSGYAASDGSTGDEAIYVNIATGSMNITVGGAAPSIMTAGCSVTVVTSARTVTVTAQTTGGTAIQSANVFLRTKTGGTGPFPENATVTISNSGTTATVTHSAHGMASNDYVLIDGAGYDANNGVFQITWISSSSYSYTMSTSPGDGAVSGTIKCWFVFLKGLSDVNGEIDMSRSIPSDQDVEGWARKSSGSPYYQEGSISGTVSSSGDTDFTATMASDE